MNGWITGWDFDEVGYGMVWYNIERVRMVWYGMVWYEMDSGSGIRDSVTTV